MATYAILGIHGHDCVTVVGDVARVRFFVDDKVLDEDVPLPMQDMPSQDYHNNPVLIRLLAKDCEAILAILTSAKA